MKLCNKKTGEIKDFGNLQVYAETENTDESQLLGNFDSFKQILEYYEDYIPPEPLIKDEKMRKAVRAWAEAEGEDVLYVQNDKSLYDENRNYIEFLYESFEHLEKDEPYTIEELCGDEEQ